MPSWAPESSVDRRRSALRTDWLRRSSGEVWLSTRPGSSVTRENSLATNTAVPSVSRMPSADQEPLGQHAAPLGRTTNADPEVGAGEDRREEEEVAGMVSPGLIGPGVTPAAT